MSLCIAAGGKLSMLAVSAFTLAWVHSVEKTGWEEDWRIADGRLILVEARIKGSGAGMEPPPDARLEGGWWRYAPDLAPQQTLRLARSGAAGTWRLCSTGGCLELGAGAGGGAPVEIAACEPGER